MKEKDLKHIEQENIIVPLVVVPLRSSSERSKKNVEVRLRCYKLASEILLRETKEEKRLG